MKSSREPRMPSKPSEARQRQLDAQAVKCAEKSRAKAAAAEARAEARRGAPKKPPTRAVREEAVRKRTMED